MNEQDLLMQVMASGQAPGQAPSGRGPSSAGGIDLSDPSSIDWGSLAQEYQLSPEQVQILQIPQPADGPSLSDRLERMRTLNTGGWELKLEDNGITGSMRF